MNMSAFQYYDPSLIKLDFKINESFIKNDEEKVRIENIINVKVFKGEDSNSAKVVLEIEINQDDCPFSLDAEMAAVFKWDDSISEEDAQPLLQHNAPALLLGYIRPIISYVTKCSSSRGYDIPYMDFTQDADDINGVNSKENNN